MSDRIAVMRDGEIVQFGDPLSIYRDPGLALRRRIHGPGEPAGLDVRTEQWRLPELGFALARSPRNAGEGLDHAEARALRVLDGETAQTSDSKACFNNYLLGSRTQVLPGAAKEPSSANSAET